jgi:Na+/proline symporter
MTLTLLDWAIMGGYFAVSLAIGLVVARRAGKDFSSFFLGGQRMPWWLLGISMVATTFSTDTPNLVADIVRSDGTFGNWTWWAFLLTGMLTVFLFAKLWRRSGVFTDIEFYEIRYSGTAAAFLRAFRAAYLGLFFNVMIMATVTLAIIKIGGVMMGWSPLETVFVAASVTLVYSTLGGLTGVLLTDLIQFVLAMVGSVGAAWYVVTLPEVGGLDGLLQHANVEGHLGFWPSFETMTWQELLPVFIVPLTVQWWAAYYPGAEPGGGGYMVQRMLAAKDEKNAVGATLLFNVTHYALRPWPWILVALASLIVFPDLAALQERFPHMPAQVVQNDMAYPAMLTLLPSGLLGIVVTSLAAAYMSTMSTQVNWGSSIVVNDLYKRFYRPEASQKQLVRVGRISTVVLMVVACALALLLRSALQMFEVLLQVGAGTGLLLMLRWFWWRVNAWSEVAAMVVSFLVAVFLAVAGGAGLPAWARLVVGVVVTTAAWLAVTYATRPTDRETLFDFYRTVQPGGPGWAHVRERARQQGVDIERPGRSDLPYAILCSVIGTVGVFCVLFATGFALYGRHALAALLGGGAALAAVALVRLWPKLAFGEAPVAASSSETEKQPS